MNFSLFLISYVSCRFLYDLSDSLSNKIKTIATEMYSAAGVSFTPEVENKLRMYEEKVSISTKCSRINDSTYDVNFVCTILEKIICIVIHEKSFLFRIRSV